MSAIVIPLPLAVGLLVFLLLASAFFSGAETALTRSHKVRMRLLAEKGHRGAKQAERLMAHPERMLAAVLLGNNFVNIAASSIATALFVAAYGEAGVLYATVAVTVVVLVFAEILPKTLAVAHAEGMACKVAAPLKALMWLLAPLISLAMALIAAIKRMLQVPAGGQPDLTHQELATIIDIGAETGVLDKAREQMLANSLSLHEVPVKALMTPRKDIVMLDAEESVASCLAKVRQQPHSRYPVYHGKPDDIIGIVHLRDLIKLDQPDARLLDALIWRDPPYIPDSKNALAQLVDFQARHQHMALIVDEHGDLEGLITLEDIIEDIVGEIVDESDRAPQAEMWAQPDGSLVVAGTVPVHDINQAVDIDLPEEGATTIGGFIVELLGGPLEGRLCLPINGWCVEVLRLSGQWISRVRLRQIPRT